MGPEGPIRSPSRFRFRPPNPLTFGFRLLPSVSASTYLRSVLGANRNLGEGRSLRKRSKRRKGRNLQEFNYPHFHSRPCSLWKHVEASLAMPGREVVTAFAVATVHPAGSEDYADHSPTVPQRDPR